MIHARIPEDSWSSVLITSNGRVGRPIRDVNTAVVRDAKDLPLVRRTLEESDSDLPTRDRREPWNEDRRIGLNGNIFHPGAHILSLGGTGQKRNTVRVVDRRAALIPPGPIGGHNRRQLPDRAEGVRRRRPAHSTDGALWRL